MRELIFDVKENIEIADNIYRMILSGDTSDMNFPGQFINIKLNNHYLRRPFSVCDWDNENLTIIYRVVGNGTQDMTRIKINENLSILSGLGNGYDISENENQKANELMPVIIGGGSGIPPLYGLAKKLIENNVKPSVILGFNTKNECFYINEFMNLGLDVRVTTIDGSLGIKGVVTDAVMNEKYVYVCGPLAMMKSIYSCVIDGQFSFESRMGCGFGACMGCSMRTKNGTKRICTDGPIFKHSEIIFDGEK